MRLVTLLLVFALALLVACSGSPPKPVPPAVGDPILSEPSAVQRRMIRKIQELLPEEPEAKRMLEELRQKATSSEPVGPSPWNKAQKQRLEEIRSRASKSTFSERDRIIALQRMEEFASTSTPEKYPNTYEISMLWKNKDIDALKKIASERLRINPLDLPANIISLQLSYENNIEINNIINSLDNLLTSLDDASRSSASFTIPLMELIRSKAENLLMQSVETWDFTKNHRNEVISSLLTSREKHPLEPYLILIESEAGFSALE